MTTLWCVLRRKFPKEIHFRIKRYSMEEVLQDSNWLFKKWAEKDRLLSYFAQHQQFPTDSRGYRRQQMFDTRQFALESSAVALLRLLLLPCIVPVLLFLSFPLFWTILWIWLVHRAYRFVFPDPNDTPASTGDSRPGSVGGAGGQTPGSADTRTPYPATPFASPSVVSWRGTFSSNSDRSPDR